jgi:hypothetical protein
MPNLIGNFGCGSGGGNSLTNTIIADKILVDRGIPIPNFAEETNYNGPNQRLL